MKKILSIFLAVCLCVPFAFAFSACGKKKSSQKTTTKEENVEKVGSAGELLDAFASSNAVDRILLTDDIDVRVTIENSKNVTLDLNGYSLYLEDKNIFNTGNLKIVSSGSNNRVTYFNASRISSDGKWTRAESDEVRENEVSDARNHWDAGGSFAKVVGGVIYGGTGYGTQEGSLGGAILNTAQDGKAGKLEIENISIVGCNAVTGGAIANVGGDSVTLDNVGIFGCRADDGGAIYNGNKLTLKNNCFIYACFANETNSKGGNGGAILSLGHRAKSEKDSVKAVAELKDSSIRDCGAAQQGGAICNGYGYNESYVESEMTIDHCWISSCTSNIHGGLISNNDVLTITNCKRTGKVPMRAGLTYGQANAGGGIYNIDTLTIKDSDIKDCRAVLNNGDGGYGGAIFNDGRKALYKDKSNKTQYTEGNMLDAKVTLEGVNIFSCTSAHKNDPNNYNESIYVRNASLEVTDCCIQNMIFCNDDDMEQGFAPCQIRLVSGYFTYKLKIDTGGFKTSMHQIADGSTAVKLSEIPESERTEDDNRVLALEDDHEKMFPLDITWKVYQNQNN